MTAIFGKVWENRREINKDETKMLEKLYKAGVDDIMKATMLNILSHQLVLTGSFNNTQRALFWQVEQATPHHQHHKQGLRVRCMEQWKTNRSLNRFVNKHQQN